MLNAKRKLPSNQSFFNELATKRNKYSKVDVVFSINDFVSKEPTPDDYRLRIPAEFSPGCEPESFAEILKKALPVIRYNLRTHPDTKIRGYAASEVCDAIDDYFNHKNSSDSEICGSYFIGKFPILNTSAAAASLPEPTAMENEFHCHEKRHF